MAFSAVAHTSTTATVNGTTAAVDTTGADLLVAVITGFGISSAFVTISDSKFNTWTLIGSYQVSGGGNTNVGMYYVASPTVGSGHTFSFAGASFSAFLVEAWSGSTATPLDQTNQAAAAQAGSVTPTQDNELLVAGVVPIDGASVTSIDLSFTISDNVAYAGGNNEAGAMAYLVETTATAKNPTWTVTSGTPGAFIATFKAAAAAASFTYFDLTQPDTAYLPRNPEMVAY